MFETLRWLAVAEVVGLAAYPIAFGLFPALRDRGWGLSKPLGLLLAGFAVWLLAHTSFIPNSPITYWSVLLVAISAGGLFLYSKRSDLRALIVQEWRVFLIGELLFLTFFSLWLAYRAYDPNIAGTEKPMDLLFLNASVIAENAPPNDPWLSGHPVAYYYFGYWMLGGLSHLAAVPTSFAFNLSLGLIAGMSSSAIFSLVYSMVRTTNSRMMPGVIAGIISTILLLVTANLIGLWEIASLRNIASEGFYEWLAIDGLSSNQSGAGWRPDSHWWWWRASRIINIFGDGGIGLDYTIQEFPSFSLLLGDLHPHLISMPFVILGISLIFNLWRSPEPWGFGYRRRGIWRPLLLAIVIAGLGFINMWDLATVGVLLMLVASLKRYGTSRLGLWGSFVSTLPAAISIFGLGIAMYSPFYFGTFSSQVQPGIPIGATLHSTRPIHFFTVWGLALLLIAPFLITQIVGLIREHWNRLGIFLFPDLKRAKAANSLSETPCSLLFLGSISIGAPFVIWATIHLATNNNSHPTDLLARFVSVFPLGLISFVSIVALVSKSRRNSGDAGLFALTLITLSLFILYCTELIYVRDMFGNRMNTVFKSYYQVWILLAVAGGYAINYWRSQHAGWQAPTRYMSKGAAIIATVLVVVAIYYSVAAAFSKTDGFKREATIDGLAFIELAVPDERAAINWLRKNADSDHIILEAVGDSYSEFGRISAASGIPTPLGWLGHQLQWRGSDALYKGRSKDIEQIYTTQDIETTKILLRKYDVTHVFIGQLERARYQNIYVDKFDKLGRRVFDRNETVIYMVGE